MSLEENIRKMIADEMGRAKSVELVPVDEFCEQKEISRTTLWRSEKRGQIKLVRIGRRVFIDVSQFAAA